MRKYSKHRADRDVLTEEGPPESDYTDRQLQKAVEYLIAQIDKSQKPSDPKTDKKESKGENKEAESPSDDNGAASVPRFILIPRSLAG